MPRTGRPKSENPKGTQLSVRFDEEGLKKVDEIAKAYSETRAEVLRHGVERLFLEIKK